jgi:hypothetical protein
MNTRNWKWMVPGVLVAVAMLITAWLLQSPAGWVRSLALVPGFVMLVCAIAAIGNLFDYRRERAVDILERRQIALSRTPQSAELESMRGLSAEVVKLMLNERHRVWALRNGERGRIAHAVLYHEPGVTDIFVDFFLRNSREDKIMTKRVLVEGRKSRFDPWGILDEYAMYDRFVRLLVRQGKLAQYSEKDAYEWVKPWGPYMVAIDFGLEWEEEVEVSNVPEGAQVQVQ